MRRQRFSQCSRMSWESMNGRTKMAKAVSVSAPRASRATLISWSRRITFYIALFAIWELISRSGIWPDYVLPGPLAVLNSLVAGFAGGLYLQAALVSLQRLAIGYGISLVLGLVLGLLIGRVRIIEETLGSLILGLQALPSVCWLPLAILWLGLSEQAIIFVVVMGALFSITLGVDAGVKNTSPVYLKAARNMGSRGVRLYTQVILPAALPAILNGLKQGWTFAWRSLMAGAVLFLYLRLPEAPPTQRGLQDVGQALSRGSFIHLHRAALPPPHLSPP